MCAIDAFGFTEFELKKQALAAFRTGLTLFFVHLLSEPLVARTLLLGLVMACIPLSAEGTEDSTVVAVPRALFSDGVFCES